MTAPALPKSTGRTPTTTSRGDADCVYYVCMARLNVYVPDELAKRARAAGLNVSALTQAAITAELDRDATATDHWLATLPAHEGQVSHEAAMVALDAARAELEGGDVEHA
jgi:post-segregation antitoxin (ccd killing protein)